MPRNSRALVWSAGTLLVCIASLATACSRTRAQPARPAPPAQAVPVPVPLARHLVAAQLRAGVDSFSIVAGGVVRGWQRLTVAREGNGWLLRDAVELGAAVRQESQVRVGEDLREVRLRQEGKMGPSSMEITLDWTADLAGDRVRGTAITPSSGPSGRLAIDTVLAPGTVDDNAVLPLLPALRWGPALDVAFPVIASGKGTVSTYRVRVLARDSTTVPAGHFATWRAEMDGGGTKVVLHVTQSAPFRIVRASPAGAPFEMQRAR